MYIKEPTLIITKPLEVEPKPMLPPTEESDLAAACFLAFAQPWFLQPCENQVDASSHAAESSLALLPETLGNAPLFSVAFWKLDVKDGALVDSFYNTPGAVVNICVPDSVNQACVKRISPSCKEAQGAAQSD